MCSKTFVNSAKCHAHSNENFSILCYLTSQDFKANNNLFGEWISLWRLFDVEIIAHNCLRKYGQTWWFRNVEDILLILQDPETHKSFKSLKYSPSFQHQNPLETPNCLEFQPRFLKRLNYKLSLENISKINHELIPAYFSMLQIPSRISFPQKKTLDLQTFMISSIIGWHF